MAQALKVPFGIRENGKSQRPVLPAEVNPADYGRRCGLVCPECGGALLAVRRSASNPILGISYFRHESGEDAVCSGYGERSSHMLAERVMSECIGMTMRLPASHGYDAFPHTSRYSDSGRMRRVELPDETASVLAVSATYDELPDFSYRCVVDTDDGYGVLDEQMTKPCEYEIVDVKTEQRYVVPGDDGIKQTIIPDIVLTLETHVRGKTVRKDVPVEIRWAHKKEQADVEKYACLGMSVLEITISDIDVTVEGAEDILRNRLLGTESDSHMREWLYNDAAHRKLFGCDVIYAHTNDYVSKRLLQSGIPSVHVVELGRNFVGNGATIIMNYQSYSKKNRTIWENDLRMTLTVCKRGTVAGSVPMSDAASYVARVEERLDDFKRASADAVRQQVGDRRYRRYLDMCDGLEDEWGAPASVLYLSSACEENVDALDAGLLKYRTGYCMKTGDESQEWWNWALRSHTSCERCRYNSFFAKDVTVDVPGGGHINLVASLCRNPKNATRYGFFLDEEEMVQEMSKHVKYCNKRLIDYSD